MLSETAKRRLLIAGFIVVVIAIALALYFVFFKAAPSEKVSDEGAADILPGSGALPGAPAAQEAARGISIIETLPASTIATGGLTKTEVVNFSGTIAAAAGTSGDVSFLNANDGRFYKITKDGRVVTMSDKQFFGVDELKWNDDKNKTIMEFPDGSNVYFDFDKQKQVTLPKHWEEFNFAQNDDHIAAKSLGDGREDNWLITANPDGSGARALEPLGSVADKVTVSYAPNGQTVAFSETGEPVGGERQSILLIGKNGENLPKLIVDGTGFLPNWSPGGKKLVYSTVHTKDSWNPRLYVVNGQGDSIGSAKRDLGLNTWADKCTFANEFEMFCAVPSQLEAGMGLERSLANFVPDSIVKVDIRNGAKTEIGRPEFNISIRNISTDGDLSQLFLTDAVTGALHKMRLK